MARVRWVIAVIACMFFVLVGHAASAAADPDDPSKLPHAPVNERILLVPVEGDTKIQLQVTVYTPPGTGPFPLAVMNHGATADIKPALEARYRYTYSAYYFLSRGYAVALPMMRGYAGSGGRLLAHGCDLAAVGLDAARDIRTVIAYMGRQPYVDPTRIVVAGQSFGGWNTLALGTLPVANLKGLINFSGGMIASDCAASDEALVSAAGKFGAASNLPSIWFYGDNDKLFAVSTWRAMHDRYTKAGGRAELVDFGRFMDNAHDLLGYPEGLSRWVSKLDAFLGRVGMPNRPVNPEYMPMQIPPATHYAAIDDFDAVPFVDERARALFQRFLSKPVPRAIAIASNGFAASYSGGFDPLAEALALCSKGAVDCRLYAVDNEVVWQRPQSRSQ